MKDLLRCTPEQVADKLKAHGIVASPCQPDETELGEDWKYVDAGVQLQFANGRVQTVFLYGLAEEEYQPFDGAPLESIPWHTSFEEVVERLGQPDQISHGGRPGMLGQIPPWLRYDSEDGCLHLQFRVDKSALVRVTWMIPEVAP